jgi:Cu(I)/Ag(I) efflux system membrane fusion protein
LLPHLKFFQDIKHIIIPAVKVNDPAVTSPVSAKDEMGMDYIPVYADASDSAGPAGTVKIDPVLVQKMGVRTGMAMERSMSRVITTPARVAFNEESLTMIHSKFNGWAE